MITSFWAHIYRSLGYVLRGQSRASQRYIVSNPLTNDVAVLWRWRIFGYTEVAEGFSWTCPR
jgi:hypothetical protein